MMGVSEVYENNQFQQDSILGTTSPKSDLSDLRGEIHVRANNKGGQRNVYLNDKSTSASSSVTSTPPLQAVRAPTEKIEESLNINSKSLSIRVP